MKIFIFGIVAGLAVLGLLEACNYASSQNQESMVTNKAVSTQLEPTPTGTPTMSVDLLCSQLHKIKKLPYNYGDVIDDPIYNQLLSQRELAIPCLVDKITDTTLMQDPSTSPSVQDFRVGDAAMFVLLFLTKEKWQPETMLSPHYAELWKTEGVYAYFAYVKKPANRKKLQKWWADWMKENLNK